MERAKLIVKNFGPLKDIEIEVREMVTFIGAQASGKSTLAKLISILEDEEFRKDDSISFEEELKKYNIHSFLNNKSHINYCREAKGVFYEFTLENNTSKKVDYRENLIKNLSGIVTKEKGEILDSLLDTDLDNIRFKNIKESKLFVKELKEIISDAYSKNDTTKVYDFFIEKYDQLISKYGAYLKFDSIYIPTERNILHIISTNALGLINNNIQIPKHLLNSGQDYEKAINTIKELPLNIIDKKIKYKREGKTSYIYHNENEKVDLLESASGLQSVIPILLLVEYSKSLKENYNFNFVVEEPELNLYPKAQHELIKYLIKNCLFDRKNLILTTHSPFVLASINNLLLAYSKGKKSPTEVNKIIKKESWLNPKNFIAYELKNGKAKLIMDDKLGQIAENMIDGVSDTFADEFDKLLDL
ncbi:AAA family ATPase [Flavobacterium sp. CFBP9031]|uniref:AAA family ATPase n=1 Tax=Flavobacterium sp. CFBP9031 TaxID=3096538 RepID=UPI002A6AAC2E|nr:AAA family ATPase [Flavobacterium sp. CFBP9031]MDY0987218.1 AAA family ATPase [Flavobacterium sp. CFBP9031]